MSKLKKYDVTFSIKELSLKEQNEFFQLISSATKKRIDIEIHDSAGGMHFLPEKSGIDPDGEECDPCGMIDCNDCLTWTMKKEKDK